MSDSKDYKKAKDALTAIKEKLNLSSRAEATLDELDDYVYPSHTHFKTLDDLLLAIWKQRGTANEALQDIVAEMADNGVSVYTADQMEWLANNYGRADQEEAIACGSKTAQEIAAFCWYQALREDYEEDIQEIQDGLENADWAPAEEENEDKVTERIEKDFTPEQ
jgi:hypothetical protein